MEEVKIEELDDVNGGHKTVITSTKFKEPFVIVHAGYNKNMFEVITTGKKASALNGFFTSAQDARKAVLRHIRMSKPSKSTERDRTWEKNHAARNKKEPGS